MHFTLTECWPVKPKLHLRVFSFPARRQAVLAESSEPGMPNFVYPRKYLPTKTRVYCVTNKQQHDLAKKFPDSDVAKRLDELAAYLQLHQDQVPASGNKATQLIERWFSGAC